MTGPVASVLLVGIGGAGGAVARHSVGSVIEGAKFCDQCQPRGKLHTWRRFSYSGSIDRDATHRRRVLRRVHHVRPRLKL